jgi:hypothetical protein
MTSPDPTAAVRRFAYTLMIAVAVAVALGRIFSAERVYEPHLSRAENNPDDVRSAWPKTRPEPMPTFSSNDRSRWATVRALVDHGTYIIGRREKTAGEPGYEDKGIVFESGWETVDKVLNPARQEFYSSKPPLLPTLVAGEYWLLKNLFGWTITGQPWHVVGVILVTINVLPLIAYLVLLVRLVERFGTSDWGRLFVIAAACFGTLMTPFLNTFNNHTLGTFCTLFALYAALKIRVVARSPDLITGLIEGLPELQETFGRQPWHGLETVPQQGETVPQRWGNSWRNDALFILAGLFAGFTACNELPALAFTVLLGLLLMQRSPWRAVILYGGAALLPIGAEILTDYLATGEVLPVYSKFGGPWYEYQGSHWVYTPGRHGIDWAGRSETKAVYALQLLLGHHGFFSLTPIYLLGLFGMAAAVRQLLKQGLALRRSEPISWAEIGTLTLVLSVIIIGYYIYKSDNYGGFSNGPRWLMWLAPLWLLTLLPIADRLGGSRWGRTLALILLGFSVFSASYSSWNPWRHPWIYDWMNAQHWIAY